MHKEYPPCQCYLEFGVVVGDSDRRVMGKYDYSQAARTVEVQTVQGAQNCFP